MRFKLILILCGFVLLASAVLLIRQENGLNQEKAEQPTMGTELDLAKTVSSSSIIGLVTDIVTDLPIRGAKVEAQVRIIDTLPDGTLFLRDLDQTVSLRLVSYTDAQGRFTIKIPLTVQQDLFIVTIKAAGYQEAMETMVKVEANKTTQLNVKILPLNPTKEELEIIDRKHEEQKSRLYQENPSFRQEPPLGEWPYVVIDPNQKDIIWLKQGNTQQPVLRINDLLAKHEFTACSSFGGMGFSKAVLSPSGSLIFFVIEGGDYNCLGVYDMKQKKVNEVTSIHGRKVKNAQVSYDSRYLVVEDSENDSSFRVSIWDLEKLKLVDWQLPKCSMGSSSEVRLDAWHQSDLILWKRCPGDKEWSELVLEVKKEQVYVKEVR